MKLPVRRDDAAARQDGFTLVEMVVTITVIGALFLAVAVMLDSGLRALSVAKARARGNDVATAGIEDLQRYSFNNLALCYEPPGTPPEGLDNWVKLPVCPTGETEATQEQHASFEDPCNDPVGNIPRRQYTCTRNNVQYSVTRYVAWVDAVQTTKRLAVFVEWVDAAGTHRVSQQSSLRAPDQAAITGLAPPKFTTTSCPPTVSTTANSCPTTAGSSSLAVTVTATNTLTSNLEFTVGTENLNGPASSELAPLGSIPPHGQNDILDISVNEAGAFPDYNGFPIMIDNESFTVISGAGTESWRVVAGGTAQHSAGATVSFVGDQVFATLNSIGSNDFPQSSTVSLLPDPTTATRWTGSLGPTSDYRFGAGSQYVSFGILRAADGKRTSTFSSTRLEFCTEGTDCTTLADRPLIEVVSIQADTSPAVSYVPLTSGGELQANLTLKARTTNVSDVDRVTVNFLTQAGSITVTFTPDPLTPCPATSNTTPGLTCQWIGSLSKDQGYRFAAGNQKFYFAAQQVLDADATTIDNGSTAAAVSGDVEFRG